MFSFAKRGCGLRSLRLSNRKNLLIPKYFSTESVYDPSIVRNCAIIAHVDHGKTTLMDKLLDGCGSGVKVERAMDSNVHEIERGITITSKYTRLHYKNHMLHIVDTPGHADFSGEVERIMSMVDGVILLVDANEGPMSQTKFVLSKALQCGKKAIVVLNKVDREGHRASEVENEILDLFIALGADDLQLDYPVMYASARQGWVSESLSAIPGKDCVPLLDKIISHFPPSSSVEALNKPFSLAVNTIQGDNFLGRIVTGKVETGKVSIGDPIHVLDRNSNKLYPESKVSKLFYLEGLNRVDVDTAYAGQIVSVAGSQAGVADTVCSTLLNTAVVTPPLSPPVISMNFGVNSSPLLGKEGTKFTAIDIKNRLHKEVENNVTLSLRPAANNVESIDVQGRGELQIGILVETMRREGFELTISPPEVLTITDENGNKKEPVEEVVIDIEPDLQGLVIESMSNRGGNMISFKDIGNRARMVYEVPSRGLVGFRHEITNVTRGNVTVNSSFLKYENVDTGSFYGLKKGKLVSTCSGTTTAYALRMVEERGLLMVGPGEEVYEGMVIGENARKDEMDVNPCKAKKLTNIRSTGADEYVKLTPPKKLTVEEMISYMDDDELLEVTPKSIRLRKRVLDGGERARQQKQMKQGSKAGK
jgi:GTP-binding protein